MTAPRSRALLGSLLIAGLGVVLTALAATVLQARASSMRQQREGVQDRAELSAALINDVILGMPQTGPASTPSSRALAGADGLMGGSAIVAVVGPSDRVLAAAPQLRAASAALAAGASVRAALLSYRRQVTGLLPGPEGLPAGFEEVTPYRTPTGLRAEITWLAQRPVDAVLDRYLTYLAHYSVHARQTRAWLLDGAGKVIATSAPATRPRLGRGADGYQTEVATVPSAPWRIVYQVPTAALYSGVGKVFSLSLALLASLLVAGLACLILLLRLSGSLRDLRHTNRRLAERNADVERATEAKSRFVANMSHELRTPLNAVIGFSELIREGRSGPVSDAQREYLDIVMGSAEHIVTLIDDVLDLSRVEAGHLRLAPREIDPVAVGRECARSLLRQADQRGIALELCSGPVGTVRLDDARLRQVILNFLSNAIKFSFHGGSVQLTIDREDDELLIEVSDNGRGIAPEDQARVFEEFVQLEGSRRGGSGLGLAVTRLIVEAQGGRVGVRSAPGSGSTFWARLPMPASGGSSAAQPPDARLREGEAAGPPPPAVGIDRPPHTPPRPVRCQPPRAPRPAQQRPVTAPAGRR